jgi:hypothetical protein
VVYLDVGCNFYWTMTTTEIITFDELSYKIESVSTDNKFRTCGESLLTALNDWPTTDLKEPKDLLEELKNEIRKPLTFDNLNDYSNWLRIDISGNAWKMESITSLLEMFDFDRSNSFDKEITLDKIIERLTYYLRSDK